MMEKLLPQNIEAECGVLGSVIIDPEAITRVEDFLLSEDFYRDAHRSIYAAIQAIIDRREPPDFITICDELERGGKLDEVGGASYITSLINQVPTSGNVEYYALIVERSAILRRLIYAAGQIAAVSYESNDASVALEKAESLIFQISRRHVRTEAESLAQLGASYLDKLERLHSQSGAIIGVPTGYRALNHITGGWQKTDLIVLAARPGMGKTALALNLARTAALHGTGVGFYSLEMGKDQLYTRLLSHETGIDSARLRSGRINDEDWEAIVAGRDRLDKLPIYLDETGNLTTAQLRSQARKLCTDHQIGLLVVDYLQLLQAKNEQGKRYDDDVKEVTEISRALKGLAKELHIPVLALSQLNRSLETRQNKRPMLSDLRSSGSIEQDSDLVMFLYRDSVYHDEPTDRDGRAVSESYTELNVEKHRNGPVGDISLYFDAAHTRFTDEEVIAV